MSKQVQVIRFNVQVTENVSFMLEVKVSDLESKNIEDIAKKQIEYLEKLGYFEGCDIDDLCLYGKITFAWQGWA